jgi:hypothetical protein
VIYCDDNTKFGFWKQWGNCGICNSLGYDVKCWYLIIWNYTVSFKIIICCFLQFSCGACSPEPFGSNSGSSLLKLAQDFPAKSTTETCFLHICKVYNSTWKLQITLSSLWVTILNNPAYLISLTEYYIKTRSLTAFFCINWFRIVAGAMPLLEACGLTYLLLQSAGIDIQY